jgi:HTH-type transcriptional regulator/antitoxin HigA
MTNDDKGTYQPDLAVPPGETVKEAMEARGMNQAELADRLKKTKQEMTAIINGKQEISPDVALRLETVMGIPASFWLNLQAQYDETLARLQRRKAFQGESGEVNRFPYSEMAKLGWVPPTRIKTEKAENLLSFFSVTRLSQVAHFHKAAYTVQYRRSAKRQADPDHLAAWLRRGEIEAKGIDTPPFDKNSLRNALQSIRALTLRTASEAGNELRNICRDCGVAVVYLPHLAQTYVNGATLWLRSEGSAAKDKPVVILSDRYKWADIFWFTVFHEIYHVLSEKKNQVFVELPDIEHDDEEKKANRFAADVLIPLSDYSRLPKRALLSVQEVKQSAATIAIHPGVLVGRLQYDGVIPRQNLNGLRIQYHVGKES